MEKLVLVIDWFLKEGEDDSQKDSVQLPYLFERELRSVLHLQDGFPFCDGYELSREQLAEICRLFETNIEFNDKYIYFIEACRSLD